MIASNVENGVETRRPRSQSELLARVQLLSQIDDAARSLLNPDQIVMRSATLLGEFLNVNRCAWADIETDEDTFNLTGNYLNGSASMVGRFTFHEFSPECLRSMRAGEPYVVHDSEEDWSTQDVKELFRATQIRSVICVPVNRSGIFTAAMAVHCIVPRVWSPDEIALVQAVANRCWESIVRIRADKKTQDTRDQLNLALEAGHAGIFDWIIPEDRIIWSPQLEALYGVAPGTFEGRIDHWSRRVVPEDGARVMREIEGALASQQRDYGYDFRACLPDGSHRWLHGQAQFSYAEDGSPLRMIGINVDIHERRMAELALRQTEQLAAVGRLAASIAHEINNPLEAVTNLLYLAQNSDSVADIQGFLRTAEQEIARVSVISSQTLSFYKQSSAPRSIRADELFHSVVSVFHGRMLQTRVQVEQRSRAQEPVQCFDGEIRQVLSNLVANAIDSFPRGGGRLLLRSRKGTDWNSGRRGLVLTVADTGSGIPPKVLQRLFEAFFTTKGSAGNGLGLWVSKEIVDRHNAVLRVRSSRREDHSGTVFTLFLPFEAAVR
jgi:PAS domain S-box-containing protein